MSTLVLDIEKTQSQKDWLELFKKSNLHKGDILRIQSRHTLPPMAMTGALVLLFICIRLYFHNQNRKSAELLLDDIFKNKSPEEIEKEIERECEIEVEVATHEEREDFLQLSKQSLVRAYSENEPDYDTMMVKEPNPEYNP